MKIQDTDFIESLAKGLAVLESFSTDRQRLNASLAAQRAGISRTAARRHLLTLTALGYLETEGGYFWLTSKALRFTGSYLATARLPKIVQPILHRLSTQSRLSFSVVVRDGDEVVIIARSAYEWHNGSTESTHITPYGLRLGARLPIHATSTGRIFLAMQSKSALRAWLKDYLLLRLTPYTLTDKKQFLALLDKVQKEDFCLSHEEHEMGISALAIPLRNQKGELIAALNIVESSKVLSNPIHQKQLHSLLLDTARELRPLL